MPIEVTGVEVFVEGRKALIETRQLTRALGSMNGALAKTDNRLDSTNRKLRSNATTTERSTRAWKTLRTAVSRIVLPIAGFAALTAVMVGSVRSAETFQRAFVEIQTITDEAAFSANSMRMAIEGTSKAFGRDAVQQARAYYQVVSAGASSSAEANSKLELATALASASLRDTAVGVDAATTIWNAFGLAGAEAEAAIDSIFTTIRLGKTNLDEYNASVGQAASIFRTAGGSLNEMNAALVGLTSVGIKTPEAFTAIRASISAALSPTSDSIELQKELGIEWSSAAIRSKGYLGALKDIRDATGGNEEQLARLFPNIRALNAVLPLTGNAAGAASNALVELRSSLGAVEEGNRKVLESLPGRKDRAIQELQSGMREIGEVILPQWVSVLEGAARLVRDISEVIDGFGKNLRGGTEEDVGSLVAGVGIGELSNRRGEIDQELALRGVSERRKKALREERQAIEAEIKRLSTFIAQQDPVVRGLIAGNIYANYLEGTSASSTGGRSRYGGRDEVRTGGRARYQTGSDARLREEARQADLARLRQTLFDSPRPARPISETPQSALDTYDEQRELIEKRKADFKSLRESYDPIFAANQRLVEDRRIIAESGASLAEQAMATSLAEKAHAETLEAIAEAAKKGLGPLAQYRKSLEDTTRTREEQWVSIEMAAADSLSDVVLGVSSLEDAATSFLRSVASDFTGRASRQFVSALASSIPGLAEGGIVRRSPGGTIARIGEGRFDEAVIPLNRLEALRGGRGQEAPTSVYNIRVDGSTGNPKGDERLARLIRAEMVEFDARKKEPGGSDYEFMRGFEQ